VTASGGRFGATRGIRRVRFGSRAHTTYLCWSDTRISCRVAVKVRCGAVQVTLRAAEGTGNGKGLTVER
jgi:hypothetical protein